MTPQFGADLGAAVVGVVNQHGLDDVEAGLAVLTFAVWLLRSLPESELRQAFEVARVDAGAANALLVQTRAGES